jgi:hypothetical protein
MRQAVSKQRAPETHMGFLGRDLLAPAANAAKTVSLRSETLVAPRRANV